MGKPLSPAERAFVDGTSHALTFADVDPTGAADFARYQEALRLKEQGDLSSAAALLEKSCCPPSIYKGHYRVLFQIWRRQNKDDLKAGNHSAVVQHALKMIRYDDEMIDTMLRHWSRVQDRILPPDCFEGDRNLKVTDVRCLATAAGALNRTDLVSLAASLLHRFEESKPTSAADGLPAEIIGATEIPGCKSWRYGTETYTRPEELVLAVYRSRGFEGCWCRGGTVNLMMKSASFPVLVRYNSFASRDDARRRFFEAQCTVLADKADEIIRTIAEATLEEVSAAANEILCDPFIRNYYPQVKHDFLLTVWKTLGAATIAEIARVFLSKPYDYRSGWPDLTLVGADGLRFVEVKTNEGLQSAQWRIVRAFARPLGLKFSMARVQSLQ
ncbi:MAG: hypothetical protein ACR2NX_13185 [Chthoniobacterales bacterium]